MENIDIIFEKINASLNEKLQQLEFLEVEKKEIISMYDKAKPTEKALIDIEMKKSEEKYKILHKEILELSEKVKKLKKHYC